MKIHMNKTDRFVCTESVIQLLALVYPYSLFKLRQRIPRHCRRIHTHLKPAQLATSLRPTDRKAPLPLHPRISPIYQNLAIPWIPTGNCRTYLRRLHLSRPHRCNFPSKPDRLCTGLHYRRGYYGRAKFSNRGAAKKRLTPTS